jgi:hypothetical protein
MKYFRFSETINNFNALLEYIWNESKIAWKPVFIFNHQVKQQLDTVNVNHCFF